MGVKVPAYRCPCCNARKDARSTAIGPEAEPEQGDIDVCLYCGFVTHLQGGQFVQMTPAEIRDLAKTDPQEWKLITTIQKSVRMKTPRERFLAGGN